MAAQFNGINSTSMLITVECWPALCSNKTCGLSPLPLAPPFLKCGGELMAFRYDLQPRPSTRQARLTAEARPVVCSESAGRFGKVWHREENKCSGETHEIYSDKRFDSVDFLCKSIQY